MNFSKIVWNRWNTRNDRQRQSPLFYIWHTFFLLLSVLVVSMICAACSLFGASGNATSTVTVPIGGGTSGTATQTDVSLSSLHWCGKPLVLFQDDGASKGSTPDATATITVPMPQTTPRTVTDWTQIEPNLGFTVYLPQALPQGTCLTSVYGTFHDPVLGGSFTIGYLLPDHTALGLSEAPLLSQNTQFQCSPSSTTATTQGKSSATPTPDATTEPLQLCTGAQGTTSIVLSAHGNATVLQKFFSTLQSHVNWQPAA
ncbi:MAG TPA: hypothetical protein DHW02_15945 [Ktedonobacter sp.]|nr:hypothetical protein [Ktedonobacter sp.]